MFGLRQLAWVLPRSITRAESLDDKDIRILLGRQSQGICIASVDRHCLINTIPTTDEILFLQRPIDKAVNSDKINAISAGDLSTTELEKLDSKKFSLR